MLASFRLKDIACRDRGLEEQSCHQARLRQQVGDVLTERVACSRTLVLIASASAVLNRVKLQHGPLPGQYVKSLSKFKLVDANSIAT